MVTHPIPQWFEGSKYTHQVAACITKYGPVSRIALSQLLGLSQGAVSRITSDLLHEGVIAEADPNETSPRLPKEFAAKGNTERRGRPQTGLKLNARLKTFIGIKLSGTLATAVATDAGSHIVTGCHEQSIDDASPEAVVETIAELVRDCSVEAVTNGLPAPCAIGITIGGHVEHDTTVTFAPFLMWENDVNLSRMVTYATGLPTGIYNDIDSILVDACWFGPGVGLDSFAALTIGAGVGYSLATHGKLVECADKSYGLVGHIPLDPNGPICTSGHRGCSQCLSNDSIADEYSQMMGRAVTFGDFERDAYDGVPQATKLVDRTCFRLGTLIAIISNIAMPEKIMIAGESAFIAQRGISALRDGIKMYRHNQAAPVQFEIIDHDWSLWAKAAATRAIVSHIE
ncbi:ROK family protein [Bifidobacterium sp. 64T4]|uniref:ROK family transcriptional regulator n=1 Tax=Bifidobacterium pongonis TaxID=2834432 RepID=UPI001C5985F0|nr:ROK family transcriptional regulator [Bifidobacterium pongonis]MBW3095037.1 ROK family protein [Bifidobacterium pongonis]